MAIEEAVAHTQARPQGLVCQHRVRQRLAYTRYEGTGKSAVRAQRRSGRVQSYGARGLQQLPTADLWCAIDPCV